MKDIQNIVNEKVAEMIESGVIQKKIESAIESAVESAIDSQFRSYGSVTKQLEKVFEDGLKINPKTIGFDEYSMVMLSAVKTKLNDYFAEESSSKFMRQLDEMFSPAPKEMDIHDLVNSVVEFWREDNESYNDWEDYAEASWDCESNRLNIHVNENRYSHSKAKELSLYIRDGEIRINHKMKYNPTALFGDDAFIFRMYAAGTKITGVENFDSDQCNMYVGMDGEY